MKSRIPICGKHLSLREGSFCSEIYLILSRFWYDNLKKVFLSLPNMNIEQTQLNSLAGEGEFFNKYIGETCGPCMHKLFITMQYATVTDGIVQAQCQFSYTFTSTCSHIYIHSLGETNYNIF